MACVGTFSSLILRVLHFLLFIIGGLTLGVGIWIYVNETSFINTISKYSELKDMVLKVVPILSILAQGLIISGTLLLALSIFGLCAFCSNQNGCLTLYAILLLLAMGLQIGAGVYTCMGSEKVIDLLQKEGTASIGRIKNDKNSTTETSAWHYIMESLECCGFNNYTDFTNNENFNGAGKPQVPQGCCKKNMECTRLPTVPTSDNSNMNIGCFMKLKDYLAKHLPTVYIVVGSVLGIEILIVILTIFTIACRAPKVY